MPSADHGYQPVSGSERVARAGARRVRDAQPQAPVQVTVVLRRPAGAPAAERAARIDRAEAERLLGADPADLEAVQAFADGHGLAVRSVDRAARAVVLAGTVEQMNAAFRVSLGDYEHPDGSYRGREGAVHLPAELAPAVVAVLGLDDRPQARAHFRLAPTPAPAPSPRGRPASPTRRSRSPGATSSRPVPTAAARPSR